MQIISIYDVGSREYIVTAVDVADALYIYEEIEECI